MRSPRDAFERLQQLAGRDELERFCEDLGIRLLVAFGSATGRDGTDQPKDLDVAVLLDDPSTLVDAVNALTELLSTDAIDVVDLRRAGPVLRQRALVGTVPLYERERGTFAEEQIAAMLTFMDTAWLRRLDLETMAGR